MPNDTVLFSRWFNSLTAEEIRSMLSAQPYQARRIADLMAGVAPLDPESRALMHTRTRMRLATERERASSVDRMLRPNLASGRWGHHHIDYLGEAGYFSADEIVENMMRMEEPE